MAVLQAVAVINTTETFVAKRLRIICGFIVSTKIWSDDAPIQKMTATGCMVLKEYLCAMNGKLLTRFAIGH